MRDGFVDFPERGLNFPVGRYNRTDGPHPSLTQSTMLDLFQWKLISLLAVIAVSGLGVALLVPLLVRLAIVVGLVDKPMPNGSCTSVRFRWWEESRFSLRPSRS